MYLFEYLCIYLNICAFFQPFQAILCIFMVFIGLIYGFFWAFNSVKVLGVSCPRFGRVLSWVLGVFSSLMGFLRGVFNGLSN